MLYQGVVTGDNLKCREAKLNVEGINGEDFYYNRQLMR